MPNDSGQRRKAGRSVKGTPIALKSGAHAADTFSTLAYLRTLWDALDSLGVEGSKPVPVRAFNGLSQIPAGPKGMRPRQRGKITGA